MQSSPHHLFYLVHIESSIVRITATDVGPDKVDNIAIDDVILEMNLDIEALPPLTLADNEGTQVLRPYLKMIRYDAAEDGWYSASDWVCALAAS